MGIKGTLTDHEAQVLHDKLEADRDKDTRILELEATNAALREEIERLRDEAEIEELPDWLLDENHRCRAIYCIPECPAYDYGCRLRVEGMATAEKALEAVREWAETPAETAGYPAEFASGYEHAKIEARAILDGKGEG